MPRKSLISKAFWASFTLAAARYIRPGNAQPRGHLLLRIGSAIQQAIAHLNHRAFPPPQAGSDQTAHRLQADPSLDPVMNFVLIRPQNVDQRDLVSFTVRANRILQGHFSLALLARAQAHEDFVLDAPCTIGAQLRAAAGPERIDPLDQAHRPNGDQIILIAARYGILARDMRAKPQIMRDERLPCFAVPLRHSFDHPRLLLTG